MKGKFPLALSVAILCLLSVWITGMPTVAKYAPTYAVFLTWASYFTAGGGIAGLKSSLITNIAGALWGFVGIVVLMPLFSFAGDLALGVAIFIVGGAMVLEAYLPILSFVPGCFIGCATYFAVTNSALIGPEGSISVLIATVIGAIVGNLLGILSDVLANVMTKKEEA